MILSSVSKTQLIIFAAVAMLLGVMLAATPASAQTAAECRDRYGSNPDRVEQCISGEAAQPIRGNCGEGEVETSFSFGGKKCLPENSESASVNDNPIYILFIEFLKFFSALVGVAVTGGIIWGGILWSTAQGNPSQTQKATTVITNAIIGLVIYILMFAIINFLVPGGLFA